MMKLTAGGRNKPTLTCVDDERITVCAEGVRVGGEVEIEVEFDSDPAPTKVRSLVSSE
jgi:hypothetical protein